MEKMFSTIMAGFMKGGTTENLEKIMAGCQEMANLCPCLNMKDLSEDEKKARLEKMMSFCGGKMEMMSAFFKPMDRPQDPACCGTGPSKKAEM